MSSKRPSTRSQANRPRTPGEYGDNPAGELPPNFEMDPTGMDMAIGNIMIPGGGWPVGYQTPPSGSFLGYQYQHNVGSYPEFPPTPRYQPQYQPMDTFGTFDDEPTPGTSKNLQPIPRKSKNMQPAPGTSKNIQPIPGTSKNLQPISGTSKNVQPIPGASRTLRGRKKGGNTSSKPVGKKGKATAAALESAPVPLTSNAAQEMVYGNIEEAQEEANPKRSHGMIDSTLSVDQMAENCVFYMFLQQYTKIPVKRSDLIKNAMNGQHKQFSEVIKKLKTILADVFGMELVRLGKGEDGAPCATTGSIDGSNVAAQEEAKEPVISGKKNKGKASGNASITYIIVNKFPSSIFDASMFIMGRRDPEADTKKTVLYLILSVSFMLNQPIDEDLIWYIITTMQFDKMVCEKRSELRKFLKLEYVSSCFLTMEMVEIHNPARHSPGGAGVSPNDLDNMSSRYSWGPRAHMEYSKYAMLSFVVSRFAGRKAYEFAVQYNLVQRSPDIIDRAFFEVRDSDGESPPSTPADGNGVDGNNEGESDGIIEGESDGNSEGESGGNNEGKSDGSIEGGSDGNNEGESDGSIEGGSDGKNESESDGNGEGGSDGNSEGGD